jgi:hypothetical protein
MPLPTAPVILPGDAGTAPPYVMADGPPPGGPGGGVSGNRNFPNFIGFLSNPLQNIDPRAVTEIYPIFASAWVSPAGPLPSSDFQIYAPGLTLALSERLAVGLNQGGYAAIHISRNDLERGPAFGGERKGFLNLGGFAQYTLIEDVPEQFLLTAGLRLEAPAGSTEVFQGHGPVHLAPYLTAGKELGCYHVLATSGYEFPAGSGDDVTRYFYANLHLDRQLFGWFYPLVEFNWTYHTTSVDLNRLTRRGFFDLNNFEASGNILTLAAGANAVLVRERLEIGAVYSTPLATQRDFDLNALLVRIVLRF